MMLSAIHPWWAKIVRGVGILILASLASITLGDSVIGRDLSRLTLDQLLQAGSPEKEDRIVLIDITDDDYRTLFNRRRPLAPEMIFELIRAAHQGGAKVIAVDIITEDWPDEWTTAADKLAADTRVVWARSFHFKREGEQAVLELEPFLGDHERAKGECYGVPFFGESVGVLRWFYPSVEIAGKPHPSFVQQVLHRGNNYSCMTDPGEDRRRLIIDFSVRLLSETASALRRKSKAADWSAQQQYAGKIVVLGGSYHAGGDLHRTPVGLRSGLEMNGYAFWSVLSERARREVEMPWALAIDLGVGFVLMLWTNFGRRLQLGTILSISVLFIVISLYMWQYYLYLSFIPIVIGVFLHWYLERQWAERTAPVAAGEQSTSPPMSTTKSPPTSEPPRSTPAA